MGDIAAGRASISIITASFNSAQQLPALTQSLQRQTDQEFDWVVADGASTDGTLEYLRTVQRLRLVVSSMPDFGIYDALNRAISLCSGEYYIVAGADDEFHADAVARFRAAIERDAADLIVANVVFGRRCFRIKRAPTWLVGEKALIANHSVGTAIRKSLHDRFGFYSRKFPIAADSLFLLLACKGGATRNIAAFTAGSLGMSGVSGSDRFGSATELFRVQLLVGHALIPQLLLLLLRILKASSSGVRSLHDALLRHAAD
jgi:glycosyltransferase involved in cell wall biosynthesis